ncbi:zinc-ribbon domain-containing protein [Mameliella alba]|nr:zinc-ribbon domain-containing protein [Mameliella alba]MBY6169100.1 zinc-ribbon domain-containing protein [Mameliella alba]MBY6173679.1 zinc-ribbon domain-containing protein [Mameliella alba]
MRLVCPNCGAQYDVPLEVIPEAGRDVQCSNCGHTWFQKRLAQTPDARATQPVPAPEATETPDPLPEPAPEAPQPAPRNSIDPEMAELFREEREFEARQRQAEALETQPDLGLEPPAEDEQARRARESRERMARLKGEDIAEAPKRPEPEPDGGARDDADLHAAAAAAAAASRRDLLPDVEEINQTLRSTSEPRVVDRDAGRPSDTAPRQKGSPFARGFMVVVMLATLGVGLYVATPRLSQQVPKAAPFLDAYVDNVNKGRRWLDAQVTDLLVKLDQVSSEAAEPATPPASDN